MTNEKDEMIQFNIKMPADLIATFTDYCKLKDLNRSAVMRKLIATYLEVKSDGK